MSHKLVSLHIGDGEYYTRIDADVVIAELKADYKEACGRLQTANLIKDEQLAAARHHKYKRCVAMYRYCAIKALYELDFKGNDVEWKWYSKWMHKWFELAEKFKDKEA